MEFRNKVQFNIYLKSLKYIGMGSEGICYYDKISNRVYKIFHEYYENDRIYFTKEEILQYSGINNKTYIWPNDVIIVDNMLIGYTMPYINAKNLYLIDPLKVSLNGLKKALERVNDDTKILTKNNIKLYDVGYNILYKCNNISIIDTINYENTFVSQEDNMSCINKEIMEFLVDGYFDYFIENNKVLNNMYNDELTSGIEFINEFKKVLSEYSGNDINYLYNVKELIRSTSNSGKYARILK